MAACVTVTSFATRLYIHRDIILSITTISATSIFSMSRDNSSSAGSSSDKSQAKFDELSAWLLVQADCGSDSESVQFKADCDSESAQLKADLELAHLKAHLKAHFDAHIDACLKRSVCGRD